MSPTIAEYFGLKAHGILFGSIIFCGTISAATAPILAGYIFDTTGSYSMMFRILIVMASSGLILTFILPRKILKKY
jgi:cyanate permease